MEAVMKKIKLGIIGIGNMGKGHLQNVIDGKCPSVEVAAVCDIDENNWNMRRESCRAFFVLRMRSKCMTAEKSTLC